MQINNQDKNILKGYNMLLYFAGSMIMYEPNEECITDFWTKGILRNLPVSSANPNFMKAASQLRESCHDKDFCASEMHEDYLRLFARNEFALAPAYESLYSFNVPVITNNRSTGVSEFYKAYGWKSKFKGKLDDDHLGVELLFLTVLIEKYIALDDEACCNEMRNEIHRFIDYHLLSWVPEWNNKVQMLANTLSFKGIGTLILACAEDILSIFDQKQPRKTITSYIKN
jgi:putative dimethyl sulfoxide reductase chaperone